MLKRSKANVDQSPARIKILLASAKAAVDQGNYDLARKIYLSLVDSNPKISEILISLPEFLKVQESRKHEIRSLTPAELKQKKIETLVNAFSKSAKDKASAIAGAQHCVLAESLMKSDSSAAFNLYNEALKLNPNDFLALTSRGVLHADKERYDLAFADLDKAIKLEDKRSPIFLARAQVHCLVNNYSNAEADVIRALMVDWTRLTPNEMVKKSIRIIAEAQVEEFSKLWKMPDKTVKELIETAHKQMSKKEISSAVRYFSSAIYDGVESGELSNEEMQVLYYERSKANLALQNYNQALYDITVAIWWHSPKFIKPETYNIQPLLVHLRHLYICMGNFIGAERTHGMIELQYSIGSSSVLSIKAPEDKSMEVHNKIFSAELLQKAKDDIAEGYFETAEIYLNAATKYDSQNIEAYIDLSFLHLQNGNIREARAANANALDIDSNHPRALSCRELILSSMKNQTLKLAEPVLSAEEIEKQRAERRRDKRKKVKQKKVKSNQVKTPPIKHTVSDVSVFANINDKKATELAAARDAYKLQQDELKATAAAAREDQVEAPLEQPRELKETLKQPKLKQSATSEIPENKKSQDDASKELIKAELIRQEAEKKRQEVESKRHEDYDRTVTAEKEKMQKTFAILDGASRSLEIKAAAPRDDFVAFKFQPTEIEKFCLRELKLDGHLSLLVGGCLFNKILNKGPVKEIDIVTTLSPEQIKAKFPNIFQNPKDPASFVTYVQGIENGRVVNIKVDIRHNSALKISKLADANTRDVRFSTLLGDEFGNGYDPTGEGLSDLKAEGGPRYVPVLPAKESFRKDPLRMMRALYSAIEKGAIVSSELLQDIRACLPDLLKEVKADKFKLDPGCLHPWVLKILIHQPEKSFPKMIEWGVLDILFPGMSKVLSQERERNWIISELKKLEAKANLIEHLRRNMLEVPSSLRPFPTPNSVYSLFITSLTKNVEKYRTANNSAQSVIDDSVLLRHYYQRFSKDARFLNPYSRSWNNMNRQETSNEYYCPDFQTLPETKNLYLQQAFAHSKAAGAFSFTEEKRARHLHKSEKSSQQHRTVQGQSRIGLS